MTNFEIFPEKPPPPPPPAPHPLDDLFTKVASLWLWSVFFLITIGLSVSFVSSIESWLGPLLSTAMTGRVRSWGPPPGGAANLVTLGQYYTNVQAYILPVVHIAGMIANIGSWAFLYLYFTVYLLPAVVLKDPNGIDDRRRRIAAAALRRTYLLTIASAIARLLPETILFLGPVLSRII